MRLLDAIPASYGPLCYRVDRACTRTAEVLDARGGLVLRIDIDGAPNRRISPYQAADLAGEIAALVCAVVNHLHAQAAAAEAAR